MQTEFSLFLFYTVFTIFCNGFHTFSLDIRRRRSKNRDNLFKQKVRYTYIFTNNMKMACKIINLSIPEDRTIPEEIHSFSPEENYQMIKIGSECLLEGRKVIANLSQREIYEKIKEESKDEIQKKEMDLMVEREMSKKMEDRISKMYQGQLEQLKKQLDLMKQQLSVYESENKDVIQKHLEKEREKYDLLLNEKEKRLENIKELFDKSLKNIENKSVFKSMRDKGDAGENTFHEISYEAFKDFNGYNIKNVSTQSHCGDFHIDFQDFSVLIDIKHYKNSVPIKEILKIQNDLKKNSQFHFAWLISLDTKIDKHDRGPLMFEWIETTKCVCYINELLKQKNPTEFLKSVYFACLELFNLIIEENNEDDNENEFKITREKYSKTIEKIKIMRKNLNDMKKTIETLKSSYIILENNINEMLNEETVNVLENSSNLIKSWWEKNYVSCDDSNILLNSKEIWLKFKKENNTKNLDIIKFKKIICDILPENIIVRSHKSSIIEVKNIKLRETIEIVTEKKIKKKVDEEENSIPMEDEQRIIQMYSDQNMDIIDISKLEETEIYKVISLLVKCKIINKRSEARGYEKYIKTEEYIKKKKIINSSN